jgi:hypothetical protein
MGNVLYAGGYNPQFNPSDPESQPFQNFTVTIPAYLPAGPATLGVAHFSLIGVSFQLLSDTFLLQANT